jgi:hypothetical protein
MPCGRRRENPQIQTLDFNNVASLFLVRKPDLADPMHDTCLHLTTHIHNIQCKQLAWYPWKRDVQVYLHLLSSAFVDYKLWFNNNPAIVRPFAKGQP